MILGVPYSPGSEGLSRREQAAELQDWMVQHRRHLHRHPEVGLLLPDTHDYIESVLDQLGLDVERHDGAGITVPIPGSAPDGITTVLRTDMDALPVVEQTDLDFTSTRDGAMHACGHDLHMAMMLGAVRALVIEPPRRDVVVAFQPGEETDRGALQTLRHRNLQLGTAATAFAIHVHATEPAHTVHYSRNVFMAFGDWFAIDFTGQGGHAAAPENAGNPIEASAKFVQDLRSLVTGLSSDEHIVATVTESSFGNSVNVIPARGRLRGTIRTLSAQRRASLIEGMRALAHEAASTFGVVAVFDLTEGYPAVLNDRQFVDTMVDGLRAFVPPENLMEMPRPSMVIEDFAYFLQKWPGSMIYLGAQFPGHTSFNHSADAMYDETVLTTGATLLLAAADGFGSTC